MNDLTSWDNYSDVSEDDETEQYNCQMVNENTKKLLLRKYVSYCKGGIEEAQLSDIMKQCNYRDEEIKKKVDDKLGSNKDWKIGNKDIKTSNLNKNIRNYQNMNKNYYNATSHAEDSGQINKLNNYNANVNPNANVNNNSHNKNFSHSQIGQNYRENPQTERGYNKNSQNFYGSNTYNSHLKKNHLNNANNKKFVKKNSQSLNNNFNSQNQLSTNSLGKDINSINNNDEEEIDHYFKAALNININIQNDDKTKDPIESKTKPENNNLNDKPLNQNQIPSNQNKISLQISQDLEKDKEKDNICSSNSKTNISRLSSEDIKEFVEEIKKNKDLIQRRRNESFTLSNTTGITISSNSKADETEKTLQASPVQIDPIPVDTAKDSNSEVKSDSKDSTPENLTENSETKCEFEFSKIPHNSFLNANNYNNYFFENNTKDIKDKSKFRNEDSQLVNSNFNTGYVNMSMNMNMTMNMMYPQPPFQQGYPYNTMFMPPNMGFYYPMQMGMDPRFSYGGYYNMGKSSGGASYPHPNLAQNFNSKQFKTCSQTDTNKNTNQGIQM